MEASAAAQLALTYNIQLLHPETPQFRISSKLPKRDRRPSAPVRQALS